MARFFRKLQTQVSLPADGWADQKRPHHRASDSAHPFVVSEPANSRAIVLAPRFRRDIEGMRAVAVLLVLFYHCTFSVFQGGYVGVDVFFVISGYLITRLILQELENGTFSARSFYVRRIRRLLPAFLTTTVFTMFAGLFILSPTHLKELGVSSIFATLSLSNFHLIASKGYFETSSQINPLLHTWSLSVEEQFYIGWPCALWLAFRIRPLRSMLFPLIAVSVVCGVALSEYWIGRNPTQAYFLLPFRAHQLLVGALAVGVERHVRTIRPVMATVIFLIGVTALLASAVIFDESTPFPGLASIVPILGGFLMIVAGTHAPIAGRFLGLPLLVWIGSLSYAIYLAHWPIIAYAHYLSIEPFDTAEKWALLCASLVLGVILHYTVEAKCRLFGAGHRWREVRLVVLAGATVVLASATLVFTQGMPQRMDLLPEKRDFAESMKFEFLRDFGDGIVHAGDATNGKTALIFGDSMMQNYIPSILSVPEMRSADVTIVTRGGCVAGWGAVQIINGGIDKECLSLRDTVFSGNTRYDLIIWSQNWAGYLGKLYVEKENTITPASGEGVSRWREIIADTLVRLEPRSGKIVIIGPPITVDGIPPGLDRIGPVTNIRRLATMLAQIGEIDGPQRDRQQEEIRAMAGKSLIIDPRAIVCPEGVCRLHNSQLSYFLDAIHFTAAMTPIIAPQIGRQLSPALR